MAVAHDAVGPSSAGAGANSVSTLSWTHTTGSVSNPLIMVAGEFDYSSDTGVTASCQSDASSTGVSAVGTLVHSNNTTQGFLAMFSVTGTGAATGAHTIKLTASSAAQDIAGGSESLSGAGGTGTPVTGAGPSTTGPSVSITAAPSSVIFAAVASGNTISTQNQTQNFIKNQAGGSGFATGNIGSQRATGTGSSLAMSWTTSSGPYAIMAVEVTQFITPTVTPAVHRPRPARGRPRQGLRKRWQWQAPQITPALAVNAGVATVGAQAVGYKKFLTALAGGTAGYFTDQGGAPLLFYNAVVFGLPANAGRWNSGNWQLDYDTYFADIAGMGMTAAEVHPWGHTHTGCNNDAGNTWDSVSPWTTIPTLNSTFWQRIDYMLTAAQRNGITVLMCLTMQCDMGMDAFAGTGVFNGTSASTIQTACQNIAARYAGRPNLLFFHGDDYNNNDDTRMNAALAGLRAGGYAGPTSAEYYSSGTTSRRDLSGSPTGTQFPWGASNANWNWCYYYHVTYFAVEQAYKENSQIPVLWGDGFFVGGGAGEPADTHLMRNFVWWALASGARGVSMGSETILRWPSTAFTDLMTSQLWYSTTALKVFTAFSALAGWQNLIPDNSNLLVTAGRGTRATYSSTNFQAANLGSDNYVAASVTPDKSLAVIYCAVAMSITIDQTKVATGYTAAWMDPANGTLTPTSTGSTYSSSGLGNNSAGNADWVLVLQGPATPSASPNAGVATVGAVTGASITQTASTANAAPGIVLAQAPAGLGSAGATAGPGTVAAVAPSPVAASRPNAGPATAGAQAPGGLAAGTILATPGTILAAAPNVTVTTSSAVNAPAGVATVAGLAPSPLPAAGAVPGPASSLAQAPAGTAAEGIRAGAGVSAAAAAPPLPSAAVPAAPGTVLATGPGPLPSVTAVPGPGTVLAAGLSATVTTSSAANAPAGAAAVGAVAAGPLPAVQAAAAPGIVLGTAPGTVAAAGVPASAAASPAVAPTPAPAAGARPAAPAVAAVAPSVPMATAPAGAAAVGAAAAQPSVLSGAGSAPPAAPASAQAPPVTAAVTVTAGAATMGAVAAGASAAAGAGAGPGTVLAAAPQPVVQTTTAGTANAGVATAGAAAPAPAAAAEAKPAPATSLATAPPGSPAGSANAGAPAVTAVATTPALTLTALPAPAPAGAIAPAPAPSTGARPGAGTVLAVAPPAVAQTTAQGTANAQAAIVGAVAPAAQVPMAKPSPAITGAVAPQPVAAVTCRAGVAIAGAVAPAAGQNVGPVAAPAAVAASSLRAALAVAPRPQAAEVTALPGTVTVILTGLVTKLKLMAAAPPRGRWAAGKARGEDTGWAAEPPGGTWGVNWPHE